MERHVFLGMTAIVSSAAMKEALETVKRIAQSDVTVLITGESGSGKEVVARAVHQHSLRCNRPWVDVSCAALPDNLVESELFGYERGAFSGADTTKPGLFELADSGTLFLDEIGELEPRMQVKLLRVLDGVPYYRLGGKRKISVNVRVVAATNRAPEEAVRSGVMRHDLYHRLSQMVLRVPPLRERPEDVHALAQFFLDEHAPHKQFSEGALRALSRHPWPGNVRELRNVVTRAALLSRSREIAEEDLALGQPIQTAASTLPLCDLDAMERQMIRRALQQTGGHQERAAELLGISRRTLSRKLKLYAEERETEHSLA